MRFIPHILSAPAPDRCSDGVRGARGMKKGLTGLHRGRRGPLTSGPRVSQLSGGTTVSRGPSGTRVADGARGSWGTWGPRWTRPACRSGC